MELHNGPYRTSHTMYFHSDRSQDWLGFRLEFQGKDRHTPGTFLAHIRVGRGDGREGAAGPMVASCPWPHVLPAASSRGAASRVPPCGWQLSPGKRPAVPSHCRCHQPLPQVQRWNSSFWAIPWPQSSSCGSVKGSLRVLGAPTKPAPDRVFLGEAQPPSLRLCLA